MYIELSQEALELLCCPLCKTDLELSESQFKCPACDLIFPLRQIQVAPATVDQVYDFRIHRPDWLVPTTERSWRKFQLLYESSASRKNSIDTYLKEIDSVSEIYTNEFSLSGTILDVGGHQGRLRHFLKDDRRLYISIDPFLNVFEEIEKNPDILKAYPCLADPVNFISGHAECLPFKSSVFDWIHMRSVVDHFADPFVAFLEAYRCTRPGGQILVGVAIMDKVRDVQKKAGLARVTSPFKKAMTKFRDGGLKSLGESIINKFIGFDDHIFRLTLNELRELFTLTGWTITKEHWQKPPFDYCIYISAKK